MRFLITAGATIERVDDVRVLTNISSGHTGASLARSLWQEKHQVTLLRCTHAEDCPQVRNILFDSFASLDTALRQLLAQEDFDVIVHAAAVSDFTVDKMMSQDTHTLINRNQKIKSGTPIVLYLKPTFKILDRLLQYTRNRPVIVGFKLTSGANASQIQQAVLGVKADWVVHNDMTDIQANRRIFTLYQQGIAQIQLQGVSELAGWLSDLQIA